ncbi:thiocillin family RiPP [Streptomyces sp. ICN441]|uniref:thiocillin family RiPP n=1 Tax=Streptomyces TaxID=1883 RepID=UPI00037B660C|nr:MULTISPECIES: thiocillin family RiPP [Streptomyces]MCY0980057.1 thiocillin family RiPP [Streptomyces tirandamycinicus]NNJ03980.1 thiocillin family RiPP [Streptomyces sp. PKU-MA01144]TFE58662.1 thiocillin family RiPP [Streptomyces sp. ICN441]
MNDITPVPGPALDLRLDQEAPELEVLPASHSPGSTVGTAATGSSISTPSGCFSSAGTASSA